MMKKVLIIIFATLIIGATAVGVSRDSFISTITFSTGLINVVWIFFWGILVGGALVWYAKPKF
jgi:hypothetical protein